MTSIGVRLVFGCALLSLGLACRDELPPKSAAPKTKAAAAGEARLDATGAPSKLGECSGTETIEVPAPGLELLSFVPKQPAAIASPDRCLRVLRADPAHYRLAAGAAGEGGASYPAPRAGPSEPTRLA